MDKKIFKSAIIFFFTFTQLACAEVTDTNRFEILMTSVTDDYAIVTAEIYVKNGRLFSGSGGSYDWKRGWADFVKDFQASAIDGRQVNVSQQGESFDSFWYLTLDDDPVNGVVKVSYKIDMVYAKTDWSFGNEQAGKIYKQGLFSVTKPFFLSTGVDRPTEITFDVPNDWQIVCPWQIKFGHQNTFIADNWEVLNNNAIALGVFESVKTTSSGFDLEIALFGDFSSAPSLITETIENVLPVYLELFPDTPSEKYLMFYLSGSSEDAEAFRNGAAFTTSLALSSDNRIFWADFLAHELFHFWNGIRIQANERWQGNWFSKGFTDYYANLVLVNRGFLSEEWFTRRMENIFGNYLWFTYSDVFEGLSVRDAGKEKGRNRFGIYDAGWALAFALDHEISLRTGGEKTLDDAMTAIYERYGKTGERYEIDALIDLMSQSTGVDLELFFDKYLKTRTPLPLAEIMKLFGFKSFSNAYANEFYLIKNDEADDEAVSAWRNLITQRFPDKRN